MTRARRTIRVAGQEVDPKECTTGIAIYGDPGTGKTVLCNQIMGDMMERDDPTMVLDMSGAELAAAEWRAAKLKDYPVHMLDLFTEGSVAPDWTKLARSETDRWFLACKLFPDVKGDQNPFFNLLARELYFYALCVVCYFRGAWDFADPLRLTLNPPLLGYLCDKVPHLGDPVKRLGDTKSAHDVLSTTRMRLSPLKPAAALMLKVEQKDRIDLLNFRGALVPVGRDRDQPLWSVLYSLLFDLIFTDRLERPRTDVLGVILDECRQLECLTSLSSVMRRGRKCAIVPVATFHAVEGWYDRELQGEEILSLFGRVVALKTTGVRTAKWLADRMGTVETLSDVAGPAGEKERRELRDRHNVTPDEIRRLPRRPDAKTDRLTGYYDGPDDTYRFTAPWLRDVTPPEGWKPRERRRRPHDDQILPDFDSRDFERLNFPRGDKQLLEFFK